MSAPMSTHIPALSGAIVEVIGEAVIDTGLREIQTFVCSYQKQNFVPDEEALVSWYLMPKEERSTQRVVIRTEKGGANAGLLGTNLVKIAWLATGI